MSIRFIRPILFLFGLALPASASAVTLTTLKGQGLDHIFGRYAAQGDCSQQTGLSIDESGFTFRAGGRTVKSTRIEYAPGFMGARYEGIAAVFFPFPVDSGNFGPVIMTVNDGERRGIVRLELDLPRGQRADPFHAALVASSPLQACQGDAARAPVSGLAIIGGRSAQSTPAGAGVPANWANLPGLVGQFPAGNGSQGIDLLGSGQVAAAIRAILGPKAPVLAANLAVTSALQRQGTLYWLTGNAVHQGGIEEAYVLIDAARRMVQVGLWERGSLSVYAPPTGRLRLPADLARHVAARPPENAVPLPGTPWEVVPAAGRPPIAYVDAAGSTSIQSFSIFCEGTRPMMAVLLRRPSATGRMTVSWNFAGRLVNIPVSRGNADGTFWQAGLSGSPLIGDLLRATENASLRIDGRHEGEVSMAGAPASLRTALRPCLRL